MCFGSDRVGRWFWFHGGNFEFSMCIRGQTKPGEDFHADGGEVAVTRGKRPARARVVPKAPIPTCISGATATCP